MKNLRNVTSESFETTVLGQDAIVRYVIGGEYEAPSFDSPGSDYEAEILQVSFLVNEGDEEYPEDLDCVLYTLDRKTVSGLEEMAFEAARTCDPY
jgi:hypothetical protein